MHLAKMPPHQSVPTATLRAQHAALARKYAPGSARPDQAEVDEDYAAYRKIAWALDHRDVPNKKINLLDRWGYREKYESRPQNRIRSRIRKRHRYKAEKLGLVERHDGKELDHTCGQKRGKGMKKCPLKWKSVVVRESSCEHRKAEGAECDVEAFPTNDEEGDWVTGALVFAGLCAALVHVIRNVRAP